MRKYKRACDNKYYLAVFDHYGWACACCGETEPFFLTLDHIENDGAAHRRDIGNSNAKNRGGGIAFYRWVVRHNYPDFLQTLCHNCNVGKHLNKGLCPHKTQTKKPREEGAFRATSSSTSHQGLL